MSLHWPLIATRGHQHTTLNKKHQSQGDPEILQKRICEPLNLSSAGPSLAKGSSLKSSCHLEKGLEEMRSRVHQLLRQGTRGQHL